MRRIVAMIVLLFLLAGCGTTGQRAKGEGTLVGAGLGAAIGAGIGVLAGKKKGAAIGAGAGAAIGALGGYAYANRLDKRNQQLAGKEHDLDTRISIAREVNEDTQQLNAQLAQEVADLEQHATRLAQRVEAQQISQTELEQERATMRKKAEEAEKQVLMASRELDALKQFRAEHPQAQSSEVLDLEIQKLESQVAQLEANTNALASLGQRF